MRGELGGKEMKKEGMESEKKMRLEGGIWNVAGLVNKDPSFWNELKEYRMYNSYIG